MGKSKYKNNVEKLFRESPVVSHDSLARIIGNKGKKSYTKRMINYLIKKESIKRITKGYYTTRDDASLSVFCFQPAYFGLQDALSFYNIWEQETIPVIITSRNARSGIRKIIGSNVLIRTIKKKYFFGIDYHQQGNVAIPYSDIEKTFIDMIYFKEKMSQSVIDNFKRKLDKKKLGRYLRVYPVRTRRLVFFCLQEKLTRAD